MHGLLCRRAPYFSMQSSWHVHMHHLVDAFAGADNQIKVWDVRTFKPLHAYFSYSPVTSLDISQRGLLAVGYGSKVQVCGWWFLRAWALPWAWAFPGGTAAVNFGAVASLDVQVCKCADVCSRCMCLCPAASTPITGFKLTLLHTSNQRMGRGRHTYTRTRTHACKQAHTQTVRAHVLPILRPCTCAGVARCLAHQGLRPLHDAPPHGWGAPG
eukprot:1161046-Pelagomonas_calceolata.AAC.6